MGSNNLKLWNEQRITIYYVPGPESKGQKVIDI